MNIFKNLNPQVVLSKHKDLNPEISMVISLHQGQITYDISAPGDIRDILLMRHILNLQVDKLVSDTIGSKEVRNS